MTSIAGLNNFNNLLYNTKKIAIANVLEHRAGRVPLDLSYKTGWGISKLILNYSNYIIQTLHLQESAFYEKITIKFIIIRKS